MLQNLLQMKSDDLQEDCLRTSSPAAMERSGITFSAAIS
jgi:hypothetical protein